MREPVLAVLVNYGLAGHLERLLASGALEGQRVLLVDNASEPERVIALANAYGAESLLLDRNFGFAGAVNRAIVHVRHTGPVLLLNPDVRLLASDVAELHRVLDEQELDAVTPILVDRDGSVQVGTAGGPLRLVGFYSYFLFVSHVLPKLRGVFFTRRQLAAAVRPAWVCMACLLLAPEALARYGPIPEDELVYAEDVAWGNKASRAGAKFAVLPQVRVMHEGGAAGASDQWSGALARLAIRELGGVRGRLSVAAMWLGLAARRLLRRRR